MLRDIVIIDEEKCDGCGLCAPACAEGAIQIIDGKAKLLAENLCDGLGACLGDCPQGAITVEQREADEYDETAVDTHLKEIGRDPLPHSAPVATGGCPSAEVQSLAAPAGGCPSARVMSGAPQAGPVDEEVGERASQLRQWPIQLHLVPPTAPFLQNADLLLAADCVPFAYADFHKDYLKDRALLIACPKLDDTTPYKEKLIAMLQQSHIRSLTVAHMEVPCCSGLYILAQQAIAESGVDVEFKTIKFGLQGDIKS